MAKKLLNEEIKEFTDLDKLEVDKYINDKSKSEIKLTSKNNKYENENKNTFGENFITNMRLIGLMTKIKEHIDINKIDVKILFEKYDKKKVGKISIKEFISLFNELNIPEISEDDIDYIMICLDVNKDGKLPYKEFLSLLE